MLTALQVELEAVADGALPVGNALYIHGLFFRLLQEVNINISDYLHNVQSIKPYTLSTLQGVKQNKGWCSVCQGKKYRFRATFMQEEVFLNFYEVVYSYYVNKKTVKIGNIDFLVSKIDLERTNKFEDLIGNEVNLQKFEIDFLSPTNFRVNGIQHIFPDSHTVFKSYKNRWNTFCPNHLIFPEHDLSLIYDGCYSVRYNLHTEIIEMGKYKMVGFKGTCRYEINPKLSGELRDRASGLLKFARYCGTGYKTTMGLGQTKVSFMIK
ncbi:CRISPR-associated protein Cas6 [Desulforamulus reducens MI-1]|uniref:CRISPR-associated protein Cas6 n=1 Tax=Desulforamulus reducens (strain ATCC BAA-1160 / DSM 100696 / MI-1) TaxID=349161 RepID=A4J507_DESRM|nr:CRISPR-associated endoribonuclease Cas6 [Desulforamulus reducens]ABO50160.1 CRISPR-associated protein Cas6 [Desulforamulus reducens MI-1]